MRSLRWFARHWFRNASVFLASMLILLNAVAFMQGRAMTRFVASGLRTASPEHLSVTRKLAVLFTGVTVPRPINDATPTSMNLSFTTHHITSSDGVDLEAWFIPASRPSHGLVVVLPAYASAKSSCLAESRVIHDLDYDLLMIDFRACGGSSGTDCTIGFREADDVSAAVSYARVHFAPKRVILLGTSMGAAAAIRAQSLDHNLADALIVEAPFDRLINTVQARFRTMGLPSFPAAQLVVLWGGARLGYNAFDHNPAQYAHEIHCPVLQIHGALDARVTTSEARNVFNNFAGPKSFLLFEDAGHGAYAESHPAEWTAAVQSFLLTLESRRD